MSIVIGLMIIIAGGVLLAFLVKAIVTSKTGRWVVVLIVCAGVYFWAHGAREQLEHDHPELTQSHR